MPFKSKGPWAVLGRALYDRVRRGGQWPRTWQGDRAKETSALLKVEISQVFKPLEYSCGRKKTQILERRGETQF